MRLLIFGGTTEGRVLGRQAGELGAEVTVSVATELGAEELYGLEDVRILTGRLDRSGMEVLLSGFDLCVDATHPYARLATAEIRAACERTGVSLLRLLRPAKSRVRSEFPAVRPRRNFWRTRGEMSCWPPGPRSCPPSELWTKTGCMCGCCPPTRGCPPARPRASPTTIFWPSRGPSPKS